MLLEFGLKDILLLKQINLKILFMDIIKSLTNYFNAKDNNKEIKHPEGICPNCWGKQEWDGEYYKKIKAYNITPQHNTYNSFVHEVASKLDKITLKDDLLICETCKVSFK